MNVLVLHVQPHHAAAPFAGHDKGQDKGLPPACLPGVPADTQRNYPVQIEAKLAQHLAVLTASWGAALEREGACALASWLRQLLQHKMIVSNDGNYSDSQS